MSNRRDFLRALGAMFGISAMGLPYALHNESLNETWTSDNGYLVTRAIMYKGGNRALAHVVLERWQNGRWVAVGTGFHDAKRNDGVFYVNESHDTLQHMRVRHVLPGEEYRE